MRRLCGVWEECELRATLLCGIDVNSALVMHPRAFPQPRFLPRGLRSAQRWALPPDNFAMHPTRLHLHQPLACLHSFESH